MQGEKVYLNDGLAEENYPLLLKWFKELEVVQYFSFAKQALELKNIDELKSLLDEIESGPVFEIYDKEDNFIGYTSLSSIREGNESEFSVFILNKSYWGTGVASEATRLTLDYAFRTLNVDNVTLDTSELHERAIGFYKKMGFKQADLINNDRTVFHNGEWILSGTVKMELTKEEFQTRPIVKISPENQINPTKENIGLMLTNWNISNFSMEVIPYGVENTSIKIVSDKKYVLRIYPNNIDEPLEWIEEEARFVNFLREEGLPVPQIIFNNLGKAANVTNINDVAWKSLLMEFIGGQHIEKYSESTAREFGIALAKMHLVSQKYIKQKNGNESVSKYENELLAKIDFSKLKNKSVIKFLERAKDFKPIYGQWPAAYIHSDFTIMNTLFVGEKLVGILDFDDLHYSYLISDVAVVAWSILKKNKSYSLIKSFIQAYESIRPLIQKERNVLKDFMLQRNYFIGPVEVLLWGEESFQMKDILEAEKNILSLNIREL